MLTVSPGGAGLGGQEGAHDVAHVDVVARLEAVAEDLGALAVEQAAAEDGHHAGLAVRVLARAVDVAQAQHRGLVAVEAPVQVAVALAGHLAHAVVRERAGLGRLGARHRQALVLAVAGAAGGGEDDPGAHGARGLEHVDRADDVDVRVVAGVLHGLAHVGLGGQVEDRAHARVAGDGRQLVGRADVGLVELRLARDADLLAVGEVVDDVARPAVGDHRVGQVRADEAGSTGDECTAHAATFRPMGTPAQAVRSMEHHPDGGKNVRGM